MFAPTFHHGLGYLTPIRRALGFRTIFNVLGPLANPALVRRQALRAATHASIEFGLGGGDCHELLLPLSLQAARD